MYPNSVIERITLDVLKAQFSLDPASANGPLVLGGFNHDLSIQKP
jgi:hypothetical protein|tara:strand:- start:519 stop:653 length:135 start_codon:yes stop_codon:yes gene_type:complete